MELIIPSTEEVRRIARQSLNENFPLYEGAHTVNAKVIDINKIRLEYRTTEDVPEKVKDSTHLDIEFWFPRLSFLNSIGLKEEERGKGIGSKLYITTEDISRKLGCEILSQIPTGIIIVDGKFIETREDYLLRRGYKRADDGQFEKRL